MAARFRDVLESSGARRVVWVDSTAYAQRLFAAGGDIWSDAGRHVELIRQAQRLVGSEVIEVRLGAFHRAALDSDPSRAEVHRGRRLVTGLRRLLDTSGPTEVALEVVEALGVLLPATPVVLVVDHVEEWLRWAAGAIGAATEIDAGVVDSASVYVADAIRRFGASPVCGLVIDARASSLRPGEVVGLHSPVVNLARDYSWPVVMTVDGDAAVDAAGLDRVDAVLCPELGFDELRRLPAGGRWGGGLDRGFWAGKLVGELPDHVLAYGEIPADAQPELVLHQLGLLRT